MVLKTFMFGAKMERAVRSEHKSSAAAAHPSLMIFADGAGKLLAR